MAKILILMTKAKTLGLLDGTQHPSGFWAEEFVVPYDRFLKEGYEVDLATVGGETPYPDQSSLSKQTVMYTRPEGSPDNDEKNIAHYKEVIASGLVKDAKVATIAKKFYSTEQEHVDALTATIKSLGGTPVKAPKTNFGPTLDKGLMHVLETAATVARRRPKYSRSRAIWRSSAARICSSSSLISGVT